MKKIVCIFLTIALLIVFISCNRGENPVNTTDNSAESTTNIILATDTEPLDDKKIFNFANVEAQNITHVTSEDIDKLVEMSKDICEKYEEIRGKVIKKSDENETVEYIDTVIHTNFKEKNGAIVANVFMMYATALFSPDIIHSEITDYLEDEQLFCGKVNPGSGFNTEDFYIIALNNPVQPWYAPPLKNYAGVKSAFTKWFYTINIVENGVGKYFWSFSTNKFEKTYYHHNQ